MSGANRTRLVLAVAVGVVAFAVWAVSETQRSTAERVFDESRAAARMQTAMLDQETGLRGFALTRERPYLQPFIDGVRDFNDAAADARELAANGEQRRLIGRVTRAANRWRQLAEQDIGFVGLQPGKGALRPPKIRERKELFDEFRRESDRLQRQLEEERHDKLARAGLVSVVVILLLAIVFFSLSAS